MPINEKDYRSEAEALLAQPEGSLPPLRMLERLHRWGVWKRGSIHPRGSLTASAASLLGANLIKRILFYVGPEIDPETCRKALLALGQWGGEECLDVPIGMLQSEKTDPKTRRYCLSAIRTIGGPRAVSAIAEVLKSGDRDMHEAAIKAILDLATGGSPSDIESAMAGGVGETVRALEPHVADELSAVLSELSERESIAFNVRYQAVDTLEYLKEMGRRSKVVAFEPPSRQARRTEPRLVIDVPLPLAAGDPEQPPVLPPEAIAADFEFDPVRAEGQTEAMYIAVLPIEAEYKNDVKEGPPLVYQTGHQTLMLVLKAMRGALPRDVSSVHVRAVKVDGTPETPLNDQPLVVGGESQTFEFRLSDGDLAYPPRFILTSSDIKLTSSPGKRLLSLSRISSAVNPKARAALEARLTSWLRELVGRGVAERAVVK